jgi:hypothetical protein
MSLSFSSAAALAAARDAASSSLERTELEMEFESIDRSGVDARALLMACAGATGTSANGGSIPEKYSGCAAGGSAASWIIDCTASVSTDSGSRLASGVNGVETVASETVEMRSEGGAGGRSRRECEDNADAGGGENVGPAGTTRTTTAATRRKLTAAARRAQPMARLIRVEASTLGSERTPPVLLPLVVAKTGLAMRSFASSGVRPVCCIGAGGEKSMLLTGETSPGVALCASSFTEEAGETIRLAATTVILGVAGTGLEPVAGLRCTARPFGRGESAARSGIVARNLFEYAELGVFN